MMWQERRNTTAWPPSPRQGQFEMFGSLLSSVDSCSNLEHLQPLEPRGTIRMKIDPDWIYFWHGKQRFFSRPGDFVRIRARNLHWHAGQSTKTRSWGRDWTVFVRPNEKKWSWDLPGEMAGDALNILIFIVGWMYSTRSMLSIWDYENWPFDAWFTLDTCIYFQMKGWKPKINISEWLESTSIIMGIW
jgi:hypothetical protein